MAARFVLPFQSVFDLNGHPLDGAKLYFYETDGVTPKDTFSDEALTTANTNPVIADNYGRFDDVFLEAGTYEVDLLDKNDVRQPGYPADPVIDASDELRTDLATASATLGSKLIGYLNSGTAAVGTTVYEYLNRMIFAEDYGAAVGNSAAVNTTKIQAAINANTTGVIRINRGITYTYGGLSGLGGSGATLFDESRTGETASGLLIRHHLSVDGDIDLFNSLGNPELTFKRSEGYGAGIDLALLYSNGTSSPKVWGMKYYNASAVAKDIFLFSCDTNDPDPRFLLDLSVDRVSGNPAYRLRENGFERVALEYGITSNEFNVNVRNFADSAWVTAFIIEGEVNNPAVRFPLLGAKPGAPSAGLKLYVRTAGGTAAIIAQDTSGVESAISPGINTFADADTSPSVLGATSGITANTGATIINDIDDMAIGRLYPIIIGDANTTVDFSASSLVGNAGGDWSPNSGDMMSCIYDGTTKRCYIHTI